MSALIILSLPLTPLILPPPKQALSSTAAPTAPIIGQKHIQGPDKQPQKRRTQIQKGIKGGIIAETVAETKEATAVCRGLKAL